MKTVAQKLLLAGLSVGIVTLAFGGSVSAHVVVKPDEAVTAGFQTFTMGVPNEKNMPTTKIKLLIPTGLTDVLPTQKAGWKIDVKKDGTGKAATVKSITWSDGTVGVGLRDDFTFSGQVPDKATELQWKAYQTYSDGTVVSWDKSSKAGSGEEGGNSGPFSVTKVVADTATNVSIKKADQAAADAKSSADTAMYLGGAGVLIGLVGVYFGTRKK